ncbi:MAG: CBS domain-containing protein [Planctomycetaceae bacterium]|nr:CBS domain-containing protein [Planctomycetaceae bacterium]
MSVVQLFHQIARNDFGFFQQVRAVSDVMTRSSELVTLTLDTTFEMAWEKFRRSGTQHAPVINPEDQKVVGIVSDRDLLRHRPRFLGTAAETDADQKAIRENVSRFMTRSPIWCSAGASPVRAMSLMLDHHIDCVLVSEDGRTLDGIVTPQNFIVTLLLYHRVCTRDFNLKRLRLVDLDLNNGIPLDEIFARGAQTVRDVMTKDAHSVNRDDQLLTAISQMQDREIRHLPVVAADGKLVGMLSDRDVLKVLPTPRQRSEEPQIRFRQTLFETEDKAILHERVDAVMNKQIHGVHPDMLLTDALAILQGNSLSGVPVVDQQTQQLTGMLTTSDVLRVFRVVMQIGSLSETPAELETVA